MRSHRKGNIGFTLLEMLVVLLITAVLASLLFAAIQRVGTSADGARCVSNLRSLGLGALRFMHDQGGTLLPGKSYQNPSFRLDKPGFRDYVGIASTNTKVTAPEFLVDTVFTCPVIRKLYPKPQFPSGFPNYLNRCYVVNFFAYKDDPENLDEPPDKQIAPSPSFAGKLARIPSPTQMWMFADGCVAKGTGSIPTYMKPSYVTPANLGYDFGFHGGRQNVVFFDGHVEPLAKEDFHTRSTRDFWGRLGD